MEGEKEIIMRTTIYITKRLIIFLLLLMIGVYCTLYGLLSLYREFRCVPIGELTMDNYREGVYVAGTIESCLTNHVQTLGSQGKDLGSSGGYITLGAIYDC